MSSPESPTMRGSSNSARMPVSLTSRHMPIESESAATKSTWKPVVTRGSRKTNLRILSKFLISVRPARLTWERHANPIDLWDVSAQLSVFFKEPSLGSAREPLFVDTVDTKIARETRSSE